MEEHAPVLCEICQCGDWQSLTDPHPDRSVTTPGKIVNRPLGKGQCRACGFVQRINGSRLGLSNFYEREYSTYFERPGAGTFDAARYVVMARWVHDAIAPYQPRSIVDVGCGRGWAMTETQKLFPNAKVTGIEPSVDNSRVARENGLTVVTARLAEAGNAVNELDLAYANNVIQHATSARAFMKDLLSLVGQKGLVVLTCPDATIPGNEMLWADQSFSFAPEHLVRLAHECGFIVKGWCRPPDVVSLIGKQLVILSKEGHHQSYPSDAPENFDVAKNIELRERYLSGWSSLDAYLVHRVRNAKRVFNFGASMWSHLLRAYCPEYWSRVRACVVDGFTGTFMDRSVLPNVDQIEQNDQIVLGTNPESHARMEERFKKGGIDAVRWDHIIRR